MCTGFIKKGNDILFAYNLDIDPNMWNYKLVMNNNIFTVAITSGKTTYYTHGVNKDGSFACLPYMNDKEPFIKLRNCKRLDILIDHYLKNKLSYQDLKNIVTNESISNLKFTSLHALVSNNECESIIIEPGCNPAFNNQFAVITNYPLLKPCTDDNIFYGKDRYQKVYNVLSNSDETFNVNNAIDLLKSVNQTGQWATRLSFVYSKNNNCVYYIINNDNNIKIHKF